MKKNNLYKIIVALITASVVLLSCSDLEENSSSTDNEDEFDASPEGLTTGAYNSLIRQFVFDANGYASNWGDIGVDMFDIPTFNGASPLARNNINVNTRQAEQMWDAHYAALSDVNFSINFLELLRTKVESNSEITDIKENIAEVKFVRALINFNLVKAFESPVIAFSRGLIIRVEDADLTPNTNLGGPTAMYEFIEEDLRSAIEDLNNGQIGNTGVASKQAAQALLAKVYLQAAGMIKNNVVNSDPGFTFKRAGTTTSSAEDLYTASANLLDEVINSGIYSLAPNYGNLFDPKFESENPETLFAVKFQSSGDGDGSNFGDFYGVANRPPFGGFGGRIIQFELGMAFFDGGLIDRRAFSQNFNGVYLDMDGNQIVYPFLLDTDGNPLPDEDQPENAGQPILDESDPI